MRTVSVKDVEDILAHLMEEAAYRLPSDYLEALAGALEREESPRGRRIISFLLENARLAEEEAIPTCQDTGMAIVFAELGQEVHLAGGYLKDAVDEAVRKAFRPLRKSVVADPLLRTNTGNNTPAILHVDIVPGDRLRLQVLLKGFGAELMSRLAMLPATAGAEGVKAFVLEAVEKAGPNACPPLIVGIGLGGSFDTVALLAKKALLRPLHTPQPKPHLAQLEKELLQAINDLGIGPQGLGGRITALAVHIESYPTHLAALPVAVNFNCSAPRRAEAVI
ncbi:MAG: fumarate hydratase [Clostridiales bacterium]|nr:fumarate hydratase [Clostridiales bacterium]